MFSCAGTASEWTIDCGDGDNVAYCQMLCTGINACAGLNDTVSQYRVTQIEKLECGPFTSCFNSYFDLTAPICDDDQSADECSLDIDCASCQQSVFVTQYARNIGCYAVGSCSEAVFEVIDPDPDFKLDCGGMLYQKMTGKVLFLSIRK